MISEHFREEAKIVQEQRKAKIIVSPVQTKSEVVKKFKSSVKLNHSRSRSNSINRISSVSSSGNETFLSCNNSNADPEEEFFDAQDYFDPEFLEKVNQQALEL